MQTESPSGRGRSPSRKSKKERNAEKSASPDGSRSRSPNKDRGRSKSPSKFTEGDFERKKLSEDSAKRRQNANSKVKGLKLDPSQWTRQELIDKLNGFAHFSVDDKSGVGTISSEGRRLLSEDILVLLEIMRRVTEIQTINLSGCGLTDAIFAQILNPGLAGLRHLKELRLQSNLLGTQSVKGVISTFSKLSRKLLVLDMQFNSLGFEDGKALFAAFSGHIQELNGIPIYEILQQESGTEVLSLPDKAMRLAELGIVCGMAHTLKHCHTINIPRNRINALGLLYLIESISDIPRVRNLDLSNNPLTNDGADFTGIEKLLKFTKGSTQLLRVGLGGVLVPASREDEALSHSLMANRAVAGHSDGYYFNKFALSLIQRTAKPRRVDQLADWQGKVNELDLAFVKANNVPQLGVKVVLAEHSESGKDEIEVKSLYVPNMNIIEF